MKFEQHGRQAPAKLLADNTVLGLAFAIIPKNQREVFSN